MQVGPKRRRQVTQLEVRRKCCHGPQCMTKLYIISIIHTIARGETAR